MKAITTGFAITALAAAISGQAVAESEATFSYSGEINVESVFDLNANTQVNGIVDEIDGDQDAFELTLEVAISNGPFSGSIVIEEVEEDVFGSGPLDDKTTVRLDDLMVEEGNISFGQIGSVVATDDLLDVVTDEGNDGMSYDVEAGARYTNADMGIMVQAEGDGGAVAGGMTAFGLGANLTQEFDMGTVYADVQTSSDVNIAGDGMDTNETFFGLGAVLTPTDELTVTVAYQSAPGDARESAYGVLAEYATDTMTAYGRYGDPDTAAAVDNEVMAVGGSYTVDMLTFSADYTLTTLADNGDEAEVGVAYANDNIEAYLDVTLGNLDGATADDALIELGASLTSESGVVYAADYESQGDALSVATLSAAYSF